MKAELKEDTLDRQVQSVRHRLQDLYQRAAALPTQQVLLDEALEELFIALEELQVSVEEMRAYNNELIAAREEVERGRQHYQELFEFAPDGYIVTDTLATIQEANHRAASLLRVRQDFLVHKPMIVFIPEQDHEAFQELLIRLHEEENIHKGEIRMQPRAGTPFSAALTVSMIRETSPGLSSKLLEGRPVGLRWLLTDITERKKAQEALQAAHDELKHRLQERTAELVNLNEVLKAEIAERKQIEDKLRLSEHRLRRLAKELEQQLIVSDRLVSLGELSASLAHEFNNPLQIILGFTEDLLREVEPSDTEYKPLTIIATETERCRKIVQNLRDFARPAIAELRSTDLNDILYHSISLVSGHLRKARVQIETHIQPDLPKVYVDPQQLAQVLVNLFFNAAEAMPNGGALVVRVTTNLVNEPKDKPAAVNEVIIAVADTGTGIDSDNLSMIFHPFFTTKKKKGMGLGLSICERIMKAHGGRIRLETSLGKGTTFYLYLPVEA